MDNGLNSSLGAIHIDRNMFGPALQAGIDVNLQDKWLVNFDVKKIWFSTDVFLNPSTKIRFNPDNFERKSCFDKECRLIKSEWNKRIKVLKTELKKSIKEIPEELITIKYLY